MEKRRKGMIKQCLSFALSLVMALTIVTPVKAAQQQYVPTQEDIEITKNIKDIQTAGYYSAALMKNGDLWTWGSMAQWTNIMRLIQVCIHQKLHQYL